MSTTEKQPTTEEQLFQEASAAAPAPAPAASTSTPAAGAVFRVGDTKERRNYRNAKGEKVDSVTQVTGVLDKPALLYWAWKLGTEGVSMDSAKRGAANIGVLAHARIEAWVRDMVFDEAGIDPQLLEASDGSVERFKAWWTDNSFVLDTTEYAMVSHHLNIGGRLDIRARRGDEKGPRVLVDIKTSKGFYSEMFIQVGGGYCELQAHPHLTELPNGRWVEAEDVFDFDEVWLARVGKDEPGDMDACEIPRSEVMDLRKTFAGMALNHYNLKRTLSRHK